LDEENEKNEGNNIRTFLKWKVTQAVTKRGIKEAKRKNAFKNIKG